MNKLQFYLTKLAEECNEVAQMALKTQQFGLEEVMPGQLYTNAQRLYQELDDLMAIIAELNNTFDLGYVTNQTAIQLKRAKVEHYLGISVDLGMVKHE